MTYKEALENRKQCFAYLEQNQKRVKPECLEAVRLSVEAIEKQVPKEPYAESDGYADGYPVVDYFCPTCNEDFDSYEPMHCWKCGQAIDWSEVE